MPATVCASCGTTQGPFVRDRDFPGRPMCGFPPRSGRHTDAEKAALTAACNARRDLKFAASSGAKPA